MKKYIYLIASLLFLGNIVSCSKWLDVNTDPDKPNNESALISNRLVWMEKFYMYSAGTANMRTACMAGVYYSTNANNNKLSVTWNPAGGSVTASYQTWFTMSGTNYHDLYNSAEKEEATYYMGAANVLYVLGFMQMLDLYGEMPFTDALSANPSPKYDDGKTIYNGCLEKLDEAIELFNTPQGPNATQLSAGDIWNGGDVQKWIKLCYGLKARYLLKVSKKADLYNADAIIDALTKAPASNSDNTQVLCYNATGDVTDWLYGDTIMTNSNWAYAAYGSNQRISKYYKDLLVDMRGAGVEDPRMTKIVPAAMCDIQLGADKKVASFKWVRSAGVDCFDDADGRLAAGGAASIQNSAYASTDQKLTYTIEDAAARAKFIADNGSRVVETKDKTVTILYKAGSAYIKSAANYRYAGDTVYVNIRNNSTSTGNPDPMDMYWYFQDSNAKTAGAIGSTGSFQVRPNSDFEVVTYHEMCFIKAEVLFRKGDAAGALAAYKAGIKAHMDMMQAKLNDWKAAGYDNPDMMPMDNAAINAYMASAAVAQTAGDLKMSDIMLQKYVAMGCSIENFNDMRRFNFSAGNVGNFGVVYPGYHRSPLFAGNASLTGSAPTDPRYWLRRWSLPTTLELQYNAVNVEEMNKHAYDPDIWCMPVWWDCATDDEYYSYLK